MARKLREKSNSGVYHVMVRGVNKQNIFENTGDYMKMMGILKDLHMDFVVDGCHKNDAFAIYAYCLMPNHIHLLLKEGEKVSVSEVMRRVNVRYAAYYNQKYKRVGHLFQNRFRSEVVDDDSYMAVLLRYIHQNPLKGGLVEDLTNYPWSSWREYMGWSNGFDICDTQAMVNKYGFDDIKSWVEEMLPDDEDCLDIDNENHERDKQKKREEKERGVTDIGDVVANAKLVEGVKAARKPRTPKLRDWMVWKILEHCTGTTNSTDFQHLSRDDQRNALAEAHRQGAGYRQLQHLTGLTYYQVQSSIS